MAWPPPPRSWHTLVALTRPLAPVRRLSFHWSGFSSRSTAPQSTSSTMPARVDRSSASFSVAPSRSIREMGTAMNTPLPSWKNSMPPSRALSRAMRRRLLVRKWRLLTLK